MVVRAPVATTFPESRRDVSAPDAALHCAPMPASPPRVFLSYARKDGEAFATALRRRLATEEPEITLWQDRVALEGGVGWWTQIEAALDQVKFLVIVMTPQAMRSETTRRSGATPGRKA